MTSVYDNGVYTLPSDAHLSKLFECKEPFLKSAPNARLYDIFDGNFNVKSKTPITPMKCYDVPVIKYANNAVFSDFPRGAGINGTTFMYEDATYNEMVRAVERQNAEVPAFAPADIRLQEYDLAQRTGGINEAMGNLVRNLKDERTMGEVANLRLELQQKGFSSEQTDDLVSAYLAEKRSETVRSAKELPMFKKALAKYPMYLSDMMPGMEATPRVVVEKVPAMPEHRDKTLPLSKGLLDDVNSAFLPGTHTTASRLAIHPTNRPSEVSGRMRMTERSVVLPHYPFKKSSASRGSSDTPMLMPPPKIVGKITESAKFREKKRSAPVLFERSRGNTYEKEKAPIEPGASYGTKGRTRTNYGGNYYIPEQYR